MTHQPTKLKWKGVDYALKVYARDFGWLLFPNGEDEDDPEEWLAHVWRRGTTQETKHVAQAISKTRVQAVLDGIGALQNYERDNPPVMKGVEPTDPSEPPAAEDTFAGALTIICFAVLGMASIMKGCV